MNWREEAKELGVPLYDHELKRIRKKADVLADFPNAKEFKRQREKPETIKVIITPREATEICNKALKAVAVERGLGEPITCEKWFVNCKRKGIVFKGKQNDDKELTETENG